MNVVEWDRQACREIGRELVAWLRQEKMSPAWVLDRYEKEVVERLPDVRIGSLSLAVSNGFLFEKAAWGVRQDGKGRGFING